MSYRHIITGREYTKDEWIAEYIAFQDIQYHKQISYQEAEGAFRMEFEACLEEE